MAGGGRGGKPGTSTWPLWRKNAKQHTHLSFGKSRGVLLCGASNNHAQRSVSLPS